LKIKTLESFFNPEAIAVVGASRNKGKIGNRIVSNLIEGGFKGEIYPVNPKAKKILGLKCYKSLDEIPGKVDLVLITVPAEKVFKVLDKCEKKKNKAAIIISAGFKEIGRADLEKRLIEKRSFRILGPNTFGLINTCNNMNASFAYGMPPRGNIAFITQSGAMAEAIIMWMIAHGIGVSKIIGTGNKADLGDEELIAYLEKDEETKVIALYIEGLKDGRKFVEVAGRISKKKPIVVLKGGKQLSGVRAAKSHTGALTSEYKIYRAAFRQSGVVEAVDTTELFDMALALAKQNPAEGSRVGVVTNGGGAGVVFTDLIEPQGARVLKLSRSIQAELGKILPEIASTKNPVDILGDASLERYRQAIKAISSEVDLVAALHVETTLVEPQEVARGIAEASESIDVPLVTSWIGGERVERAIKYLLKKGIPSYPSLRRGASAVRALIESGRYV